MNRHGKRQVLVAGGGVAALEAALALRSMASGRISIELLAPETHFSYRPLAVAAPFDQGEVLQIDLGELTREIDVELVPGGLVGIDAWRHVAHTSRNMQLAYDLLLVACGALAVPAVPGAVTFRGPADVELVESLVRDLATGDAGSVAFVIPWGATYSLPAYELALLTASHLERHGNRDVEVTLVTPEVEPLQVFGPPASAAVRDLFSSRGIELRTGSYPRAVVEGVLHLLPEGAVEADRFVALPRLQGPPLDGIPQTVHGFVPVDHHCRVHGLSDVFAAGDITSFTVKHGGIATQQADAAAQSIAAAAGADVEPERFRPVLRGLLLTGAEPRYLRRELAWEPEIGPEESSDALWWPPSKIAGRHLAPFLASLAGVSPAADEAPRDALAVEQILENERPTDLNARVVAHHGEDDDLLVRDVMAEDVLTAAPEDTVGETAERMLEADARAAAVTEYGRVIGIVTSSDLLRAAAARAHPAEARVRQWMTAEPVTATADLTVLAAKLLMDQYGIDRLPVVDETTLSGIVEREALERAYVPSMGLGL